MKENGKVNLIKKSIEMHVVSRPIFELSNIIKERKVQVFFVYLRMATPNRSRFKNKKLIR
jgi:hypothetical protein